MNKGSHIQLEKVFLFSTFTAPNAAATVFYCPAFKLYKCGIVVIM